jgi:tetratricopeptide (TPR) repeat protein
VTGQLPEELAGRLHLFMAEALARLRRHAEAGALLGRVPASLLDRTPLLQLRALRIRLWLGEVTALAEELARCDSALEERGDAANRALLACEEGRAWDQAGDLARAQTCWLQAEKLVSSSGSATDAIRADVLLQLGRVDHLRGRLGPALDRYEKALRRALPGAQTLEIQLRRLLVRLDLNQWGLVRAAAGELLGGQTLDQLPEEVRSLAGMVRGLLDGTTPVDGPEELKAYLAAARGDEAAARSLYASALAANPSPERRARLALALGLLARANANAAEAQSWLRQAEELARSLQLPEVLVRTLQVCGQMAAEQKDDDELARRYFEEAVLLTEVQAGQFGNVLDVHAYRQERGSVLRHLLRSACRRGEAARVFQYQELERGRLLLDLIRTGGKKVAGLALFERPEVFELEAQIAACDEERLAAGKSASLSTSGEELARRREELQLRRDRLFEEFLRDRGRCDAAILPALPELADLQRALPAGTLYVAPALLEGEFYLLTVGREEPAHVIRAAGVGSALGEELEGLRGCLTGQITRYRRGLPLGRPERKELDQRLEGLGRGPLGDALAEAIGAVPGRPRRVLWVPDGALHGVPIHALRRNGRYLIEDLEFVWSFSGALVVHQARTRRRRWGPLRPVVVVAEKPAILPEAQREGEEVAASFWRGRVLPADAVNRALLRPWLARARVVHFACHADFDGRRPLAASLNLPSGERIHALEWLEEPVTGLPLVTLSACRSAEVAPLLGREVFGLATGLLGGGVRAVLAGAWPVADREARPLMRSFYHHRLLHDLATALALAQRDALAKADSSPLFWAAFALFGDATAIPPPGIWGRWLARWRQRRLTKKNHWAAAEHG